MNLQELKKSIENLADKLNVDMTMPVIPVLDDYSEFYATVRMNVLENVAEDAIKAKDTEDLIDKINSMSDTTKLYIDKDVISCQEDAENAIDMALTAIEDIYDV